MDNVLIEALLTNSFCLFILGALLIATLVGETKKQKASRAFARLVLAVLAFIGINIICELFDGHKTVIPLNFAVNLCAFFAIDMVVLAFTSYLYAMLGEEGEKRKKLFGAVKLSCFVRILAVAVAAAMGRLFTIDGEGYYAEGNLSFIPYFLSALIMLELIAVILFFRKCFTKRQLTVILLYELFPVAAIVIELYTDVYTLTSVALTWSVMMIYVFIQAETIEEGKMRETVLEELSMTDLLTGLNNRRSFYARIGELEEKEAVGVLFCDINGLKYANDHYGHASGDELICKLSALLVDGFGKENVFRISGDEFVVILRGITEDEVKARTVSFRAVLRDNDSISAVGNAFGKGCRIDYLISEAEKAMYVDKHTNCVAQAAADGHNLPRS